MGAPPPGQIGYIGWCPACKKKLYDSRKAARRAIRELGLPKMRPYSCPDRPVLWHVGHLPLRVRTGDVTAAEYYGEVSDARD